MRAKVSERCPKCRRNYAGYDNRPPYCECTGNSEEPAPPPAPDFIPNQIRAQLLEWESRCSIQRSEIERLEKQLALFEKTKACDIQMIKNYQDQIERLRGALVEILHEGNMATQGKWDATEKMKAIAYLVLAEK